MIIKTQHDTKPAERMTGSGVYAKRNIQIVRGEGACVWDEAGGRYIDCVSGQGANNLGHRHPALLEAMRRQAEDILVCPEMFHSPIRARYQSALCEAAGMARTFLCTSGAEAVEAALKFAHLATGRAGIISTTGAYHGRTIAALSTTWEKDLREPFRALTPHVDYVPFNDLEALRNALDGDTAAVIIEPVQGYGGIHPANPDYLREVRRLCSENDTLLIIDEIQTGFGRTGTLFAFQEMGIQPDMLCLAKSIAGGLPVGAVLLDESLGEMPLNSHGSTFGGYPVGCAVGLAVLDVLQNSDLMARSARMGLAVLDYLRQKSPPGVVREVRGRGFMIGIELDRPVGPVLQTLTERGLLAMAAGPQVIRLLPPLVITDEELWEAVGVIVDTLGELDVTNPC